MPLFIKAIDPELQILGPLQQINFTTLNQNLGTVQITNNFVPTSSIVAQNNFETVNNMLSGFRWVHTTTSTDTFGTLKLQSFTDNSSSGTDFISFNPNGTITFDSPIEFNVPATINVQGTTQTFNYNTADNISNFILANTFTPTGSTNAQNNLETINDSSAGFRWAHITSPGDTFGTLKLQSFLSGNTSITDFISFNQDGTITFDGSISATVPALVPVQGATQTFQYEANSNTSFILNNTLAAVSGTPSYINLDFINSTNGGYKFMTTSTEGDSAGVGSFELDYITNTGTVATIFSISNNIITYNSLCHYNTDTIFNGNNQFNNISVTNATIFNGNVTFSSATTYNSTVYYKASAFLSGNVQFITAPTFTSGATFNGAPVFNNGATVSGTSNLILNNTGTGALGLTFKQNGNGATTLSCDSSGNLSMQADNNLNLFAANSSVCEIGISSSNLTFSDSAAVFSGDVKIDGNLTVTGEYGSTNPLVALYMIEPTVAYNLPDSNLVNFGYNDTTSPATAMYVVFETIQFNHISPGTPLDAFQFISSSSDPTLIMVNVSFYASFSNGGTSFTMTIMQNGSAIKGGTRTLSTVAVGDPNYLFNMTCSTLANNNDLFSIFINFGSAGGTVIVEDCSIILSGV